MERVKGPRIKAGSRTGGRAPRCCAGSPPGSAPDWPVLTSYNVPATVLSPLHSFISLHPIEKLLSSEMRKRKGWEFTVLAPNQKAQNV